MYAKSNKLILKESIFLKNFKNYEVYIGTNIIIITKESILMFIRLKRNKYILYNHKLDINEKLNCYYELENYLKIQINFRYVKYFDKKTLKEINFQFLNNNRNNKNKIYSEVLIDNYDKNLNNNSLRKQIKTTHLQKGDKITDFKDWNNYIFINVNYRFFKIFHKKSLKEVNFPNLKPSDNVSQFYEINKDFVVVLINYRYYKIYNNKTLKEYYLLNKDQFITSFKVIKNFIKIKTNNEKYLKIFYRFSLKQANFNGLEISDKITKFKEHIDFISIKLNFQDSYIIYCKKTLKAIHFVGLKENIIYFFEYKNLIRIEVDYNYKSCLYDKISIKLYNFTYNI